MVVVLPSSVFDPHLLSVPQKSGTKRFQVVYFSLFSVFNNQVLSVLMESFSRCALVSQLSLSRFPFTPLPPRVWYRAISKHHNITGFLFTFLLWASWHKVILVFHIISVSLHLSTLGGLVQYHFVKNISQAFSVPFKVSYYLSLSLLLYSGQSDARPEPRTT